MAEQTRQWMEAIAVFLRLHRPLLEAHVVNFFKDRLWEMVDAEWIECLRGEPWRVCSSCPPDASRSTGPVHYENLSSPLGRLFFHGSKVTAIRIHRSVLVPSAALGPLVETYILLDRLLFLQEQGSAVEALLFPLFDPTVSKEHDYNCLEVVCKSFKRMTW